mmetsp:Transcript_68122/g.181267  ORF Transcript_68122/g.181267 Transcript_68122/m.181267 type:complete len:101 (+) Transcript_68122:2211-2513(+)
MEATQQCTQFPASLRQQQLPSRARNFSARCWFLQLDCKVLAPQSRTHTTRQVNEHAGRLTVQSASTGWSKRLFSQSLCLPCCNVPTVRWVKLLGCGLCFC